MTISEDLRARILRYYHVEKWRVGTISRELGIHHSTVERVLLQTGLPKAAVMRKPSMIEPYLAFILETLNKYPRLKASRLYGMVRERGYRGGESHFRHWIAMHRPGTPCEAYLRLRTLPGEQAQVDWGHFGTVTIGKAKRPLMAFVMVLSYSRKVFLRFYFNQQMENFLRGHQQAFEAFGGVPRVLLYDNLKSCVLERIGDAIRFHPTLLSFSAHYRFEPRPVAPARGNEKGRVERAIRYVRDNFFAARQWKDLTDLNQQAALWCEGQSADRRCPEDQSLTVRSAYIQEKPHLLVLPDDDYPVDEQQIVHTGKTPYVRFDLNDYSVPYQYVRQRLTVVATPYQVKIAKAHEVIALHTRSYDKAQQIEDPAHIEALVEIKKQARTHRGQHRLTHAVPLIATFLEKAATRGYPLGAIVKTLLSLLDDYGSVELEAAVAEALSRDVPHPNAVQLSLQKHREQLELPPPIPLPLSSDLRVREQVLRPHALSTYDTLQLITEEEKEDE